MTSKDFWASLYDHIDRMPYEQQVKIASFIRHEWPTMDTLMTKEAAMSKLVDLLARGASNAGAAGSRGIFGLLRGGLSAARGTKRVIGRGIDAVGSGINRGVGAARDLYGRGVGAVERGVDAIGSGINRGVGAVRDTYNRGVGAARDLYNRGVGAVERGVDAIGSGINRGVGAARDLYGRGVGAVERGVGAARDLYGRGAGTVNRGVAATRDVARRVSRMTPDQLINAAERRVNNAGRSVLGGVMSPVRSVAQGIDNTTARIVDKIRAARRYGINRYNDAVNWAGRQANAVESYGRNQYAAARNYGERLADAVNRRQKLMRGNVADLLQSYINRGAGAINRGIDRIR